MVKTRLRGVTNLLCERADSSGGSRRSNSDSGNRLRFLHWNRCDELRLRLSIDCSSVLRLNSSDRSWSWSSGGHLDWLLNRHEHGCRLRWLRLKLLLLHRHCLLLRRVSGKRYSILRLRLLRLHRNTA